jgi:hypothetical protein
MAERRNEAVHDTGERRREDDRREDWELRREQILLTLGVIIVAGIGVASIFLNIKNNEIALAVLALGGGFLGLPTALKLDERRGRRNK